MQSYRLTGVCQLWSLYATLEVGDSAQPILSDIQSKKVDFNKSVYLSDVGDLHTIRIDRSN